MMSMMGFAMAAHNGDDRRRKQAVLSFDKAEGALLHRLGETA
jgi:hypothetical protein